MKSVFQRAVERAMKNEKVYAIQPSCPKCDTKQVQILDVDEQQWKCRHCKHLFRTQVEIK